MSDYTKINRVRIQLADAVMSTVLNPALNPNPSSR